MLYSTRGIVLHYLKYSESSIIAKVYTELFGLQSYMVKGIRNPRARMKTGLFQPFTILELSVYHKEKSGLQNLKEAHHAFPYQTIPFDIRKSSIMLFMDEVIYKSVKEEEPNKALYHFIEDACIRLDGMKEGYNHFHLHFLLRLTEFLGFIPQDNFSRETPIFDMQEGLFASTVPLHADYLLQDDSLLLHQLLTVSPDDWRLLPISAHQRDVLLSKLLAYYRVHIPGFAVQSHAVLHDVLRDA
ncbi:MAG: DNA repair protein RecO [Syntrophothermus sp.]